MLSKKNDSGETSEALEALEVLEVLEVLETLEELNALETLETLETLDALDALDALYKTLTLEEEYAVALSELLHLSIPVIPEELKKNLMIEREFEILHEKQKTLGEESNTGGMENELNEKIQLLTPEYLVATAYLETLELAVSKVVRQQYENQIETLTKRIANLNAAQSRCQGVTGAPPVPGISPTASSTNTNTTVQFSKTEMGTNNPSYSK